MKKSCSLLLCLVKSLEIKQFTPNPWLIRSHSRFILGCRINGYLDERNKKMPRQEVKDFFEQIPSNFTDPFTNSKPSCERELTAILSVKHQLRQIDWASLDLFNSVNKERISAAHLVDETNLVFTEYPLFTFTDTAIDRWGQMSSDLLFLRSDLSKCSFIESKVDSEFTHSNEPPDGQISRYLEYLIASEVKEKSFIIICPKFNFEWYRSKLDRASRAISYKIPSYVLLWEDLYKCIKD